jgi:hypothetical protein
VAKGAVPEHLQDVTTNVCLQSSPSLWLKFGCNAVNVTLSYWAAKGCGGKPYATGSALPLGCSPTTEDPAKPQAGLRVAVCGRRQGGEEEEEEEEAAPVPLPMAEARAAATAAVAEAAAAAVARALAM